MKFFCSSLLPHMLCVDKLTYQNEFSAPSTKNAIHQIRTFGVSGVESRLTHFQNRFSTE